LLLGAALALRRRPQRQRAAVIAALLLLWLPSTRPGALLLATPLEREHPPLPAGTSAAVIVVLGGGARPLSPPRVTPELSESGDRMLYAAWLYQQAAAPQLVLSGGSYPDARAPSEAANMGAILEIMGVPPDAQLLEEASRNTRENAVFVRQILAERGIDRIILVTSATHMPRSVRLFEREGFTVLPAPTDFVGTEADWDYVRDSGWTARLLLLLPEASNLQISTRCLKEYVGLVVYRLRGWI
jgi:uncharacterized SAM-binding protein YcdF (DUF218 family)